MANNRAYLCCLRCLEAPEIPFEACTFYLLKYYPKEGWYVRSHEAPAFTAAVNAFLDQHKHGTLLGDYIRLITEADFPQGTAASEKQEILRRVSEALR